MEISYICGIILQTAQIARSYGSKIAQNQTQINECGLSEGASCTTQGIQSANVAGSSNSQIGQIAQQGNSCVNGAGCTVQGTQAASITGTSNSQINQKSTGTNTCSGTDTSCNINNSQTAQIKDISNAKIDQQLLAMFSAAEIALVAAVIVHRVHQ